MMNDPRSPLRRIAVLAALAVAALAIAGCARKVTSVDTSYVSPEGTPSPNALMVAYPDIPAQVFCFFDKAPIGPGNEDSLLFEQALHPVREGVLHGMIFDGTAANTYQVLRRESGGGYAPLTNYTLDPSQRFAQSGWKLFTWQDERPSPFEPPTYLGRGVTDGKITPQSALTNAGIAATGSIVDMDVQSDLFSYVQFTGVPGAVGYFMQVYTPKRGYIDAFLFNAAPAPFASRDHRDVLDVWLPAADGHLLGTALMLQGFTLIPFNDYAVKMSAMDAEGRLVGYTYGTWSYVSGPDVNQYRIFRLGAVIVKAGVGANSPNAPLLSRMQAVPASSMPPRAAAPPFAAQSLPTEP